MLLGAVFERIALPFQRSGPLRTRDACQPDASQRNSVRARPRA